MNKNFMIVEQKEVFNLHGDVSSDLKLSVDIKAIQGGAIKQLGIYNFSVLVCLSSHMNSEGTCFPSQKKISELTGISINKVTACVKELLETEIDGEPIFTRSFAKGKKGKRTVYQFKADKVDVKDIVEDHKTEEQKPVVAPQTPVADLLMVAEEPEQKEEAKPLNAKDIVVQFVDTYTKVFGDGYMVSWGKEMKLVKDKMIPNFESEDIKEMVKIAVEQYEGKWSNPKYPRPTISMLCGWLGKEAFKIVLAEKKQVEAMQVRIDSAQQSESEMDRFMML